MPCQTETKPEVQKVNKIKACSLIGSVLVDLAIFKLVNVNFINEIDFLKVKNK